MLPPDPVTPAHLDPRRERTVLTALLNEVLETGPEVDLSLGLLGVVLLTRAVQQCPRELAIALRSMVDDIVQHACDKAESAARQAKYAADQASALRDRLSLLEKRLDNLTPGIGDPST